VPRVAPDATDTLDVQVSPQLRTDAPTWVCWASCGNAAAGGGWTDALYLDGALVAVVGRPIDPRWTSHYFYSLNDGPLWVRGGRHTLAMHADLYAQFLEDAGDLDDDFATLTYVWPPMPAAWAAASGGPRPVARAGAPVVSPTASCEARALPRPGVFRGASRRPGPDTRDWRCTTTT